MFLNQECFNFYRRSLRKKGDCLRQSLYCDWRCQKMF